MTELIGNDVASMVAFAQRNRTYEQLFPSWKLFKAGNVSNLGGAINITYGALVYDHVNREANAHAILKKETWERSGFRVIPNSSGDGNDGTPVGNPTVRGYAGANPGSVGTVIDVDIDELDSIPGFLHTPFDMTMDAGFRAARDDGLDVWEWKMAVYRDIHAQLLNAKLLVNAETKSATLAAANVTDAKNATDNSATEDAIESLDRLISSDSEEDSIAGAGSGHFDVYEGDVDRDSATTWDSVVCRPDGTQTTYGTDQAFQMTGVDKLIDDTEDNGAEASSQIFLTKRDTRRALYDELGPAGRFDLTHVQAKLDMNGLSPTATHPGRDITYTVRAYQDRPIVVDKNVPADGKGRLYLIDQRHFHIKVGFPTLYVDADNPVYRGQFDTKALYLTCEQVYATRFNTSGKMRSIS